MKKPKTKQPDQPTPIPFDEVARRLLNTPPPATRKTKAKRAKSK